MKKISTCLFALAIVFAMVSCGGSGKSSSDSSRTEEEGSMLSDSSDIEGSEESGEDSPYINERLTTGRVPYSCTDLRGDECDIQVKASTTSDVVVIVKKDDIKVRNVYVCAGDTYKFYMPNGTYQVFFYEGKGWNPDKQMPHGEKGGFVADEHCSKDKPITLNNQTLEYELVPQSDGNFQTEPSNKNEVF